MQDMEKLVTVAFVKEETKNETRCSCTPHSVEMLTKQKIQVYIEKGIGDSINYSDEEYKKKGAIVVSDTKKAYEQDIVISINPPTTHQKLKKHQLDLLKKNSTWISLLNPNETQGQVSIKKAVDKEIQVFSLNLIPRISRAQKMDIITSQSNIAGYKAVIMAVQESSKMMPLMMTAAGTYTPAQVIILGAGVAGLQAIATAKRLGAIIEVSDVRPEVKEQVESLGARYIEVPQESNSAQNVSDKNGYATQISKEFLAKQREELKKRLMTADIVITTALVAGTVAPRLIDDELLEVMKKGSIIVDLAAVQGGNCSKSQPDKIINYKGIKIIGHTNIAGTVANHASQMAAINIAHFVLELVKEGKINNDQTNEVLQSTQITNNGKIVNTKVKEILEKTNSTKRKM